jgi:hypothetical protein
MAIKLIADSGSTKAEWCLLDGKKKKTFFYAGYQPVFSFILTRLRISWNMN